MTTILRHLLIGLLALPGLTSAVAQQVPVRLSIKFILDANGNRPPTGNINTEAEIDAQITTGNQIFSRMVSEFRLEKAEEVLDVAGHSEWYNVDITDANRDALRDAATASPAAVPTYFWRNNAVNVYIVGNNGATAAAISDFPPKNNIIVLSQGSFSTTFAHEVGHILNLRHTHVEDSCPDTINDNKDWTRDDIARNNFGDVYAKLTAGQKALVDQVWQNLMSYHDEDNRNVLTWNQLDRQSTQGYINRATLLARIPVYVNGVSSGTHDGSFTQPFQTIQEALTAGNLAGKAMVLERGTYARPAQSLGVSMSVVPRKGSATVQEPPAAYVLPYSLQDSADPAVRDAVRRAQQSDRRGDTAGVIANLLEAEKGAGGREKTALQMELAQRHRDTRAFGEAELWFRKAASGADQEKLRTNALKHADGVAMKAKEARSGKAVVPGTVK